MKTLLLALALTSVALAQTTPPNLPAFNSITGVSGTVCTFESQDSVGGLYANCTLADGSVPYAAVVTASDAGTPLGHAEIMCLYWVDVPGKYRLQCANGSNKLILDGYTTPTTRKKRWYLLWR